jgi:hypothetical protein
MPSTNGHGPKRAILYARVSTDEQAPQAGQGCLSGRPQSARRATGGAGMGSRVRGAPRTRAAQVRAMEDGREGALGAQGYPRTAIAFTRCCASRFLCILMGVKNSGVCLARVSL